MGNIEEKEDNNTLQKQISLKFQVKTMDLGDLWKTKL